MCLLERRRKSYVKVQGVFTSDSRANIYFPYFYSLEKIDRKLIFLYLLIQEQRHME